MELKINRSRIEENRTSQKRADKDEVVKKERERDGTGIHMHNVNSSLRFCAL